MQSCDSHMILTILSINRMYAHINNAIFVIIIIIIVVQETFSITKEVCKNNSVSFRKDTSV